MFRHRVEAARATRGGARSHWRPRWARSHRRRKAAWALRAGGGALALLSAACGSAAHHSALVRKTGAHTTAQGPPPVTCPLSGVTPSGGAVPLRPALAIKIDNYPTARPLQSGLDAADVVFELPVEGGITRLLAVFQCNDAPLVGPIRSARYADIAVLDRLSDPIFLHVGGIQPVIDALKLANATDLNLFYSPQADIIDYPPGLQRPDSTFVSTKDAWGLDSQDHSPPAPIFTFTADPRGGKPVSSVHIVFSSSSDITWTWNAHAGRWLLAYSGQPATMRSGAQISEVNVVVESVNVTYGPWVEDADGGLEVVPQYIGSGPVTVFTSGQELTGNWVRSSLGTPERYVDSQGKPIALQPGPTWVEILPAGKLVAATPAPPAPAPVATTSTRAKGRAGTAAHAGGAH